MKLGDVVRLSAGGPWMTVEQIRDDHKEVACVWFDSQNHIHKGFFSVDVLIYRDAPIDRPETKVRFR